MSAFSEASRRGTRAAQPVATAVVIGTIYYVTDESKTERSNGTIWQDISDGGSSGITQLTGDVTAGPGSGSQAATIGSDKVVTAKILNANVTLAKIANAVANSKLLGSGVAGSGAAYSELTLGTNLSMSGTTLNASGGSAVENYLVADIIQARSLVNNAAGNFTLGVIFSAVSAVTITGFKFAYNGFASKTVKWTLYDSGYDSTGSTVVETSTVAVSAAQVYPITLGTPKALESGKYYTIGLYINDGSNYIFYTTLLAGWRNYVMGSGNSQTENTVGPVKWNDIAVFRIGDDKPIQQAGTNASPIQLTYA